MTGASRLRRSRRIRLGSYAALLVALLVYLIVASAIQEEGGRVPWVTGLLFPVILFTTIGSATETRGQLIGLIALAVVGLTLDSVHARGEGFAIDVAGHSVHIVFLILTILIILRHVFRDASVGPDMILGAMCAYFLLGLAFNQLYSLVETLVPGSFTGAINVQQDGGYFSLVTLSTLGYGDIVPVRAFARSMAAIEAVVGQFYIAVIVAYLVALRMASSLRSADDASGEPRPQS